MTESNQTKHLNTVCRIALGLLFIYHGLVPKILWLSPVEASMTDAMGLPYPATTLSPLFGILEVVFGLLILFLRQQIWPIMLAIIALTGLLGYVAIFMPILLAEAFNPVTTNGLGLILCYLILKLEKLEEN